MLRHRSRLRIVLLGAIAALSTGGCGGQGPKLYSVSGTLTHNGKPLPNMGVTFLPVDGARPSLGMTDANGRFTLQYTADRQGARGGEHVVAVSYLPLAPDELAAYGAGKRDFLPADIKAVLEKYGNQDTSPCRVTITSNVANLEVKLD